MFCRVCGEDNDESAIYCSQDGQVLHGGTESFNMLAGDVGFCKSCGEEALKSDLYCSSCGQSFYTIESSKGKNIDEVIKEVSSSETFDIKNLLKYSLIGLGIILVISIMASAFVNNAFIEALAEETDMYLDQKLLSFLDLSTMMNASSLKMDLASGGSSLLNLSLDGILFILILVPIGVFTLIGAYMAYDGDKKDQKLGVKEYAFIAISYGILLSLLSVFASRETQFNIPYLSDYTDFGSMNFVKKYGFLNTLIKSSLLSFFSLGFGRGIYSFFRGLKEKNFTPLNIASIVLVLSSIFTLAFIGFSNRGDQVFISSYVDMTTLMALAQVFIYLLLFINMGTFKFIYEGKIMTSSLFKNMDMLKESFEGAQFLYIGLFLTMFSFFLYGRHGKKKNKEIKELLYAPAIFAGGLAILAYLTNISLSMNSFMGYGFDSIGFMSLEFSPLGIALGSFIINTLSALAGYFLTSGEKRVVARDE